MEVGFLRNWKLGPIPPPAIAPECPGPEWKSARPFVTTNLYPLFREIDRQTGNLRSLSICTDHRSA